MNVPMKNRRKVVTCKDAVRMLNDHVQKYHKFGRGSRLTLDTYLGPLTVTHVTDSDVVTGRGNFQRSFMVSNVDLQLLCDQAGLRVDGLKLRVMG